MKVFHCKFVVKGGQENSCKNKEGRIFLPISLHGKVLWLLTTRWMGWEVNVKFRDWVTDILVEGQQYLIGYLLWEATRKTVVKRGRKDFLTYILSWRIAVTSGVEVNGVGGQCSVQDWVSDILVEGQKNLIGNLLWEVTRKTVVKWGRKDSLTYFVVQCIDVTAGVEVIGMGGQG